jgi:hypothetical protein
MTNSNNNTVAVAGNELGINVWYTCPTLVLDGDKALAALEANGFEQSDMPLPSARAEVSRAAYSFQDRRHKADRRITEKATESDTEVVYGLLDQEQKGADEVAFEQHTTVRFEKGSGRVLVEGPLHDEFMERYHQFQGAITDEDIRAFLRRVIRMTYGVAKRPTGGIYFVPNRFSAIIESAQAVLDQMGTGARIYVERVMDGVQERANVWGSVEHSIGTDLEGLLKAVERIEKRASSIKNHEARLTEMGELMAIYQDLLGREADAQDLTEKLDEAAQTVAAKLEKLQEAKATATRKPRQPKPATAQVPQAAPAAPATTAPVTMDGTMLDIAVEVLKSEGPMHYRELTSKVLALGFATAGATPERTLAAKLALEVKKGVNSAVTRVGRGVYSAA